MPYRFNKVRAALEQFGVDVVKTGGRHPYKAQRDGKTYPVPAHNGLKSELADVYIRGLCRCFDIDIEEFLRCVRGGK